MKAMTASVEASQPRRESQRQSVGVGRLVSSYGLVVLMCVIFGVFSFARPDTFPTLFNIRALAYNQSITGFLALAETIPVAANQFDLSVGYGVGLYNILAVGLLVNQHVAWPVVILIVLVIGAGVGLINGMLVTRVGIDSFIATLGVGTILYGISFWYAPTQLVGNLPAGFAALTGEPGGVPLSFVILLAVAAVLFVLLEYLPAGRSLYMLGANQRAAELTGIDSGRYITFAFVLSGVITAIGGILLGSELQTASTAVGPDYLLPAFVGALLGSTAIKSGRANVLGTLVAVFIIAIAVAGLEQYGASYFVDPLFNGAMLVVAVGVASTAAKRRARTKAAADAEIVS